MRNLITLTLLVLLGTSHAATLEGRTVKITDGDTLQVLLSNGLKEKVRLIGIDAPEKAQQPWGKQATAALERMVKNQWVRLETDATPRDRYGRLLAYVYVGQTFVNLELMKQGNAVLLTYPPNVAHAEEFRAAQERAQALGLGIWDPRRPLEVMPGKFRKRSKSH